MPGDGLAGRGRRGARYARPVPLTGKQRSRLRALAHHLEPVVLVGKAGVTPGVVAQLDEQLAAHELLKVRLGDAVPAEPREVGAALAAATSAELVQAVGRTIVLFRRRRRGRPKVRLSGRGAD